MWSEWKLSACSLKCHWRWGQVAGHPPCLLLWWAPALLPGIAALGAGPVHGGPGVPGWGDTGPLRIPHLPQWCELKLKCWILSHETAPEWSWPPLLTRRRG